MVLEVGIDEAGRGPVIGPMVMAGVLIDDSKLQELKDAGVRDSKMLTHQARERLFYTVKEIVKKYEIIVVSPKEIDEALNSETLNLNKLEAIKSAMITNVLRPKRVILDCPSTNTQSYRDFFQFYLKKKDIEIIAEHGADAKYVSSSAASILAKVTRDRLIEEMKEEIDEDFGSGYPSDPKTQAFLKENYKRYPQIFRQTWASYQNVLKEKGQRKLGEF